MPLNDVDHEYFLNLIDQINQESNLKIELVHNAKKAFKGLTKSYGLFKNVNSVIVLKGNDIDDLLELCGYYGEKIVLEATKRDLGTCFVGGSFDSNFFKYDEKVICLITIGYVDKRLTMREKLIHDTLHSRKNSFLEKVNHHHELNENDLIAIEAVSLAPSAKNRKAIKLDFIENDIVISTSNTYHFDIMDLGIAKYNFEAVTGLKFPLGNNARISYKK